MNWIFPVLLSLFFLSAGNETLLAKEKHTRPNIVYILADDLGYGDLSCYGQKSFSTPNIDKLATEGMLFTQHYSGSTVCAPLSVVRENRMLRLTWRELET